MSVQQAVYSVEEIAERGDKIYNQTIRSQVEAGNRGKIVAIDVNTGAYALADTAVAASRLLRAKQPKADVWFVRVGHRALHHIGARSLQTTPEQGL